MTSAIALRHILDPAVTHLIDKHTPPGRPRPRFQTAVAFATDDILLAVWGKTVVLANSYEIGDGSWRQRALPRLDHWLSRNAPQPHQRYRPILQIKTRRPSVEQ